jgi:hypothetical protein
VLGGLLGQLDLQFVLGCKFWQLISIYMKNLECAALIIICAIGQFTIISSTLNEGYLARLLLLIIIRLRIMIVLYDLLGLLLLHFNLSLSILVPNIDPEPIVVDDPLAEAVGVDEGGGVIHRRRYRCLQLLRCAVRVLRSSRSHARWVLHWLELKVTAARLF